MRIKLRIARFIVLVMTLSLASCMLLPKLKFDPNDVKASIIFGYIDTKNMPSEFGSARIQGLAGEDDYVTASTYNGAFWHLVVSPGFRKIRSFSGFSGYNAFGQGDEANIYTFPKNNNPLTINIKKPGVYFMGSYKFIDHKKDQFDIKPIKAPSEKTVLKMILAGLKRDGSERYYPRQIKMIKKRIAKLK